MELESQAEEGASPNRPRNQDGGIYDNYDPNEGHLHDIYLVPATTEEVDCEQVSLELTGVPPTITTQQISPLDDEDLDRYILLANELAHDIIMCSGGQP